MILLTAAQRQNLYALSRRLEQFQTCRHLALRCVAARDVEGARFWGAQARFDWAQIVTLYRRSPL